MQAMILARDEKSRRKALAKLLPMQRKDFAGLFEAMDGFPVVDPHARSAAARVPAQARRPDGGHRHAALRRHQEEAGDWWRSTSSFGAEVKNLKTVLPELLKRVEELHEFNPMLGHRGCRLGITYPEITEMQARAIFEAAVQVAKKGKKVIPEVMIPLIGGVKELENQKAIVHAGGRGSSRPRPA